MFPFANLFLFQFLIKEGSFNDENIFHGFTFGKTDDEDTSSAKEKLFKFCEKIIQKPELLTHVHKELYEMIALHFGVSPESAERNIRTVKEISWEYGDKELLREIFGSRCAQPPGNAAFLDGLAAYLAEACAIEKEQDRCDRENG